MTAEVSESGGVELTDRDIDLFRLIHEERYLVFNQIKKEFWKGTSDVSHVCYQRISKLVHHGFLVTRFSRRKNLPVYFLTAQSLEELKARNLDLGLKLYQPNSNLEVYIDHNLRLTNIRLRFRELDFRGWKCERILRELEHRKHWIPDGVLQFGDFKAAIEYENFIKATNEYVQFFDEFSRNREFDLLFVILRREARDWLMNLEYPVDRVWFMKYDDLIWHGDRALFENKAAQVPLSKITGKV